MPATDAGVPNPVRVRVNLARRDRGLRVLADFEDCADGRIPQVTDLVLAHDPLEQLEVPALVAGVDERTRTLLLEPVWHSAATRLATPEAARFGLWSAA